MAPPGARRAINAPNAISGTINAAINPRMIWSTPKITIPVLRSACAGGLGTGGDAATGSAADTDVGPDVCRDVGPEAGADVGWDAGSEAGTGSGVGSISTEASAGECAILAGWQGCASKPAADEALD